MSFFRKSPAKKALFIVTALLVLAALPFAQQAKKPKVLQSTNPELRLKGFEDYKAMQQVSKLKDLKWQFIGPTNVSGRLTDVAVVAPKGKNYTIYVATASGGVWKTENEGTTWAPIFENYVSAAVGDIALAPSNPQIIWAGTGEHNIFRSSQAGCGIFKSSDGGKTWAHMGLADTNTIARIIVHPANPDVVYVAAGGHEWTTNVDRGVYKTSDGGKTWMVLGGNLPVAYVHDLIIHPRDNVIVVATHGRGMWALDANTVNNKSARRRGAIFRPQGKINEV